MSVDSERRLATRLARPPAAAARERCRYLIERALATPGYQGVMCYTLAEADTLATGDRVRMRHAKAGELAERFREYHVLGADGQLTSVPTYRGEGQCFG